MALFTPPSASEIRIESKLTPTQVVASLSASDIEGFESDIEGRILEQVSLIEQRLATKALPFGLPFSDEVLASAYPLYTSEQKADAVTRLGNNAGKVCELWTLADLWLTAGKQNPEFLEKASYYQRRGEAILSSIEAEIALTTSRAQNGSTGSSYAGTLNTAPTYRSQCEWEDEE